MKVKSVDFHTIRLTAVEIEWQLRHAKAEGCDAVKFSFKDAGSNISFTVLINQDSEDPKKTIEKLKEKELIDEPEDENEDEENE